MTTERTQENAPATISQEAIDCLLDGEPVEASALKAALATDEGRQYLVDSVSLRELLAGPVRFAGMRAAAPMIAAARSRRVRTWRPLAAAAAILIAGASGYVVGRMHLTPGESAAPTPVMAQVPAHDAGRTSVAPRPTVVLTLDPGPAIEGRNAGSD